MDTIPKRAGHATKHPSFQLLGCSFMSILLPEKNVRRQWLFLLSGASFSTTSHVTLASVDISVLLESAD